MQEKISAPVWEKYALTVSEAAAYFGIGEKKLRSIAEEIDGVSFYVGTKVLFKRKMLEKYLDSVSSI